MAFKNKKFESQKGPQGCLACLPLRFSECPREGMSPPGWRVPPTGGASAARGSPPTVSHQLECLFFTASGVPPAAPTRALVPNLSCPAST